MINPSPLPSCLEASPVRVEFGAGKLSELGHLAQAEGFSCVLLVSDPGIIRAGHVAGAVQSLNDAGVELVLYDGARENPTTEHVAAGVQIARQSKIDAIVGLGGGSSMDCAKGINIILCNGGEIADYWGQDKINKPLLPMMLIPATAGTGSEAQSFALISDPITHAKMACGDRRSPHEGGLRPRVAILDPALTFTQPPPVAAASGMDAVSHAVETAATNCRTEVSREFSKQAWARLNVAFETAMREPDNLDAHADMLMAAHLAGAAIEHSMLGAAHACANPLTATFDIPHGQAVGLMLPWVVRFNGRQQNPYADLCEDAEQLSSRLDQMLHAAGLKTRLSQLDVPESQLPRLAESAANQWTAQFNPIPVDQADLLSIYLDAL